MDSMGEEDQPQECHSTQVDGGHQVSCVFHQKKQDGKETSMYHSLFCKSSQFHLLFVLFIQSIVFLFLICIYLHSFSDCEKGTFVRALRSFY